MQYLRKCTDVLTPAFYAHSCVATPTFFGGPRQALTCDSLDSAVGHLTVAYSFRPELCCQGTAHMASALERVKDEYAAMLLASGYPNYNEGRLKRLAEGMRILREASSVTSLQERVGELEQRVAELEEAAGHAKRRKIG